MKITFFLLLISQSLLSQSINVFDINGQITSFGIDSNKLNIIILKNYKACNGCYVRVNKFFKDHKYKNSNLSSFSILNKYSDWDVEKYKSLGQLPNIKNFYFDTTTNIFNLTHLPYLAPIIPKTPSIILIYKSKMKYVTFEELFVDDKILTILLESKIAEILKKQ